MAGVSALPCARATAASWHRLLLIPLGCPPHPLAQAHLWCVTKFSTRLANGVTITGAEELDSQPRDDGLTLGVRQDSDLLGSKGGGVERVVRHMEARGRNANLLGDAAQALLLCQRLV